MISPTARQQDQLDRLAKEYKSVSVRKDSHSLSLLVDCFTCGMPELCVSCGKDELEHLRGGVHNFRVAVPVATYRISPSGFRQDITPVGSAA